MNDSQRLELGVAVVDRALELGDARLVDLGLLEMLRILSRSGVASSAPIANRSC